MNTNGERGRFDTHRNAPAPLSTWYTPFLQRAFAPKSIISPKPFSLPKTRSNLPKHPIAVANTGFCRPISLRSIRAFVALFRCAQYGLLLRYCPHSGAMRSAAPAMCSGYALARIHLRNPPVLPLPIRALHRPISLRLIRAFVALFRCAQYGLLLRYCPHSGAMRSAAPAMCSLLRRLRAYAYATRPIALGNTGQSNIIHPIHIKMILNSKHNSILSLLKTTHNDLHS